MTVYNMEATASLNLSLQVMSHHFGHILFIRIELFNTRSILYQEEKGPIRAERPVGDHWLSQKLPTTITKYASRIEDGRRGEPGSLGKGS